MASSEMVPLRIRAWMRAPVVADAWLPLDGALLAQSTRRDLGAQEITTPGASNLAQPKGEEMRGGRLPIAIAHAKDWYYRCSWAQWGPFADGQDAWAKRFDITRADLIDFRGKRGHIDTSAATYKAYHMPVFYRSALWVEWYCLGALDELTPLIHAITHLGKKTSQGWGRVEKWEIEQIGEDWSVWHGDQLMRGIPIYHWPRERDAKIGLYGIRPSYWDRHNQMELVLP
jgi:CRISPR type IV-associated protein Csf3